MLELRYNSIGSGTRARDCSMQHDHVLPDMADLHEQPEFPFLRTLIVLRRGAIAHIRADSFQNETHRRGDAQHAGRIMRYAFEYNSSFPQRHSTREDRLIRKDERLNAEQVER